MCDCCMSMQPLGENISNSPNGFKGAARDIENELNRRGYKLINGEWVDKNGNKTGVKQDKAEDPLGHFE